MCNECGLKPSRTGCPSIQRHQAASDGRDGAQSTWRRARAACAGLSRSRARGRKRWVGERARVSAKAQVTGMRPTAPVRAHGPRGRRRPGIANDSRPSGWLSGGIRTHDLRVMSTLTAVHRVRLRTLEHSRVGHPFRQVSLRPRSLLESGSTGDTFGDIDSRRRDATASPRLP